MKIIIVLASLLAFQQFNTSSASGAAPNGTDTCYTFTIDNASSDSLGDVAINGASDYADFYVTATGQYQQTLCFSSVSATVAGTTVPYPNSEKIQLANGAWVAVLWQSPSLVEIDNTTQQNRPAQ